MILINSNLVFDFFFMQQKTDFYRLKITLYSKALKSLNGLTLKFNLIIFKCQSKNQNPIVMLV